MTYIIIHDMRRGLSRWAGGYHGGHRAGGAEKAIDTIGGAVADGVRTGVLVKTSSS